MKNSLISVSKFSFEGFKVEFDKDGCKVNDTRGVVMVEARRDNNLYLLNVNVHKTRHTLQILSKKARCFGMKDLAISTWQVVRSWMPWWMA
jgi:hypothetical protein